MMIKNWPKKGISKWRNEDQEYGKERTKYWRNEDQKLGKETNQKLEKLGSGIAQSRGPIEEMIIKNLGNERTYNYRYQDKQLGIAEHRRGPTIGKMRTKNRAKDMN